LIPVLSTFTTLKYFIKAKCSGGYYVVQTFYWILEMEDQGPKR